MKRLRTTRKSFTLIELVVAMAIMIVVALIIATASSTFYNAYTRSLKATKKLKTYMAIDRIWVFPSLMIIWLSALIPLVE